MKILINQMGLIMLIKFKPILSILLKKYETITDENSPIKIYVNNIKNRIVFKIKSGYKLELLTNKDKNSTNVPQLEIVTTVLIHCNIVQNNYQQASNVL